MKIIDKENIHLNMKQISLINENLSGITHPNSTTYQVSLKTFSTLAIFQTEFTDVYAVQTRYFLLKKE